MPEVTNSDLLSVLMDIKGDVGGLKSASELHLKALESHGTRIGVLESSAERQKGAAKVWALMGSGLGASVGVIGSIVTIWMKHKP